MFRTPSPRLPHRSPTPLLPSPNATTNKIQQKEEGTGKKEGE